MTHRFRIVDKVWMSNTDVNLLQSYTLDTCHFPWEKKHNLTRYSTHYIAYDPLGNKRKVKNKYI